MAAIAESKRTLRRVGYWRPLPDAKYSDPGDELLPDPRTLVDASWDPCIKGQIVSYLRAGKVTCWCAGHSYCRFRCGTPDDMMGSYEYTDGVWVWPEGLAHYVEVHSVRLPADFEYHMQQRAFKMPADIELVDVGVDDLESGGRAHTAQDLYFELMRATSHPPLPSRMVGLSVAMVICIKALAELLERLGT